MGSVLSGDRPFPAFYEEVLESFAHQFLPARAGLYGKHVELAFRLGADGKGDEFLGDARSGRFEGRNGHRRRFVLTRGDRWRNIILHFPAHGRRDRWTISHGNLEIMKPCKYSCMQLWLFAIYQIGPLFDFNNFRSHA
jgi:hypothetical protein